MSNLKTKPKFMEIKLRKSPSKKKEAGRRKSIRKIYKPLKIIAVHR